MQTQIAKTEIDLFQNMKNKFLLKPKTEMKSK